MTKKVLSLLLTICILVSCFALVTIGASAKVYTPALLSDTGMVASGVAGEDIVWSLDENGLLTFSGTGFMSVDDTDLPWLEYSDSIKNVVVGEGIETIVDEAFCYCKNLETVEIASSVLNIGADVFFMCPMELTVKGYTGSVSQWTAGDFGYTFISLGDAPNEIYADGYFGDFYNLSWSLNTLGELYINGVGSMGYIAYQDSPWEEYKLFIRHVIIGAGVTDINENCFNECDILTDIQIPSTVNYVSDWIFDGSYMVSTVKGYDNTAAQKFAVRKGYEFISLGELAEGIITSGKLTDTVGWSLDTDGLLTIAGTGTMPDYDYDSSPAPWYDIRSSVKSVAVGEGITNIGNYAFYECTSLTDVTLADTVASIDRCAFKNCWKLTTITLPDSLKTIENQAFCECSALIEIIIPESVTTIGSEAFYKCKKLKQITVHYNVTSIGSYAFSTGASGFVLKVYTGSYAEEYANDNFITFESIGSAPRVVEAEGICGGNVKWEYDNYKILTLSGSGKTVD